MQAGQIWDFDFQSSGGGGGGGDWFSIRKETDTVVIFQGESGQSLLWICACMPFSYIALV